MAELSDTQIAQIYSEADARARAWHMPEDTLKPEVEEVEPEFFAEQSPEESNGEFNDGENSAEEKNEEIAENEPESKGEVAAVDTEQPASEDDPTFEGFQDAPFKEAPPQAPVSETPEIPEEEENLSQAEIEEMVAQMASSDEDLHDDTDFREVSGDDLDSDTDDEANISRDEIDSLIHANQSNEDSSWDESYTPLESGKEPPSDREEESEISSESAVERAQEPEETEFEIGGGREQVPEKEEETYLDIGSEEKENEPDIPPDEEGLAASQSTEPEETYMDVPQDESTADESVVDDFEGQEQMTQEDIEALLMGRDEEAPEEVENLDNMFEDSEGLLESDEDESSVLSQDDFEAEPESEPTPQEAEPESSVEAEAEFVQQAELEDEAISEPDVEPEIAAAVEEEAEELKAEEQPVEEAIEEPAEEKTVEKEPDVPQPESTASDDQMMNKEELSAILREEEQNEDAEKALDSLAEQTEEIARKLDGFEEEETGSQSQFQPGTNVNGQGEEIESTEDDPNSRKLNPKLIKPLIFTGIGAVVIMVLLYFFPMGTGKDETELALEHISEAWTWERNPDHESSVKYRIYAPGASITLSTLGGLRSTALDELDSSPLKSHYTKLEKNAEIERFRLLGDVRYVEAKDAKNSRMLHFDYFFKDQEGRFHLKRSAYFGVSELVLKLEITSITEDPDLTSESEVSQNLNQLFMDVLGISELGYLPEHEIGEDIKDFEKNTQFLAKRVILLDK